MKKYLLIAIALLCVATSGWGAWWTDNITLWAPFTDPDAPLTLDNGTGVLTFARAHDATHTATFVHPTTGLVTDASADQLRIETQGALFEEARTNVLLQSRTLNNAAWTATNTTADNTITGEDGVASSASWVAASAANGTICQAVTIASAAYSGAFSIKRITGTGTVKLSLDGGLTWGSDVASSLSASAWYRASKVNQTLANPSLCIQLGTSGDNVAVDYAQLEAGDSSLSRIPTTTAAISRNRDALSIPLAGNSSGATGTLVATVDAIVQGAQQRVAELGDSFIVFGRLSGAMWIYSSGHSNGPAWSDAATHKVGYKWTGTANDMAIDGGTVTANVMTEQSPDNVIYIGGRAGSTLNGHIKDFRFWNREFTDAELQSITGDMVAAAFTFTDVAGATLSTVYTSASVSATGITALTDISISGGTYSVNGGDYTSNAGTVNLNDNVSVRVTSSGTFSTATNATLTMGSVSDTYTVTTRYGIPGRFPEGPTEPSFPTHY